ncbi:LysE family translocator [Litoreibacter janthinus]|uniref:Threonine/homoserine/homoserine lactone efflux protein n=1 Tax=Litoreibacter janthinus TaxID=670154 RepID=A0A1I6GN20_9RHOB|nr:LysE family translocator [Litoreibacter janthinus]SFR43521.1 Threonine/homoserine/homoserine lactone efflux protein [Litoreibacter janthinus]
MSYDILTALILFAFVSSITPGPNNLMLMASGANFGFRRSIPHMLGITLGFTLMVFLVGIGLVQVFDLYPVTHLILKLISAAYMTWLAWKIANAAPPKKGEVGGTPMTFLQAAAFQWVNPKAWAMALTAITLYAPDRSLYAVAFVALIFGAVNGPSVSTWTILGQQLRRLLTNPVRLRLFNFAMAGLLIASLYPLLGGEI